MNMPGFLSGAAEQWTAIYSNHAALRTAIGFAHVGGIVFGGGCAIAADRGTLLVSGKDDGVRTAHLVSIRGIHGIVLAGLAAVFVSGLLLLAADLDTFLTSVVFWTKMGLVVLLIVNGALIVQAERLAAVTLDRGWSRLRLASIASLVLWFLTTLAGAALPNLG
jgi:hypothetical protein